jgi:thioredoxin reductase (NADPH)
MIGASPNTAWLQSHVDLDEKGFVRTGRTSEGSASPYETTIHGIYAVGDVRSGSVKRVASAVGEGSAVVSEIHKYLAATTNQSETDIDPVTIESQRAAVNGIRTDRPPQAV